MMDATMIVTNAPRIARGAVFSCAAQAHMRETPAHPSHHIRLTPDMHTVQTLCSLGTTETLSVFTE